MAPRMRKPAVRKKDDSTGKGSGKRDRIDRRRRDRKAPERAATGRTGKGRRRTGKSRAKGRNREFYRSTREKLKRWLATPADWARFNAWAQINAQPKKIPEPETIVRPSKPISQLRRRLKVLAQPREVVDPSIHCKLDLSVSKAALKAIPSIRTNLLALPIVKLADYGRVYYQVSPAALNYEPSPRIIALSQPHYIPPERCKPPGARLCRPCPDMERLKMLAMKRKMLHCPEQLTKEEIEELFTPQGTRRSALVYQITPWMEFLALPAYKTIKRRKDENAVIWKQTIINEGEKRAKDAMTEQMKKREKERRRERRLRMLRKKLCEQEKERKRREKEAEEEERRRRRYKDRRKECEDEATMRYEDERRKERMDEKKRKQEKKMKRRKDTRDDGDTKKVAGKGETEEKVSEEEKAKMKEEEERRKKKRRKRKHAWRFAPYPCKDDPNLIKKATLQFEATPRMTKLSEPRDRKNRAIKANPFAVKKAALSASASGRVETLAKPSRPRSPIERRPPREKDSYGRPIFVVPVYGKVLPKTKPYKMGECPPEEEEKKKEKKVARKRPIDSIAYEPTYDPCIYPDLAKRQKRERKRAAKLSSKKKGRRRTNQTNKDENKEKT